jgi:hypothetical protein
MYLVNIIPVSKQIYQILSDTSLCYILIQVYIKFGNIPTITTGC